MTLRGFFPSLGAGGSLIAAALCALAVFGGVIAFRGESAGTAEANSGDLVVPGRTVRGQKTSSPGIVNAVLALTTAGQDASRAERPRRPERTRRQSLAPRGGRTVTPTTTPTPRPTTPASSAPTNSSGGSSKTPIPTPTPPVPSTPTPQVPSGTVERAVAETRSAAQPVVDAVPAPAKAPVDQVVGTVENVAGTVDQTVDGVTGILLPAS
jgi:hypothetical protein